MEPGPSGTSKASAQISGQSDTDITAEFLQPLLTPDNVANLVRTLGTCRPWRERGPPSFPCCLHIGHMSVLGGVIQKAVHASLAGLLSSLLPQESLSITTQWSLFGWSQSPSKPVHIPHFPLL